MSSHPKLRSTSDWFTVESIRTIDDPTGKIVRRELVVSLKELPHFYDDELHLGPNPRRANSLNSTQRDEIRQALIDTGEQFHHLNRGLTIVAKKIDVDDKSKGRIRIRLHLADDPEEGELFGLLDGGHTNEIVNRYRTELLDSEDEEADENLAARFVNVQVLIPNETSSEELTTLLRSISRARNNNVQVKRRDLENLDHLFDQIKEVLKDQPYAELVRWRDGDDKKPIDGQMLLILLMIFHQEWVPYTEDPIAAYGQKGVCLEEFKTHSEEKSPEYTSQLVMQLPTLLKLFDTIELELPDAYNKAGGKFGKFESTKNIAPKSAKTQLHSETPWKYTTSWVYPLYAGFRQLLEYSEGEFRWKKEPVQFWKDHKVEICRAYARQLRTLASASATKVGRDSTAFLLCRQSVELLSLR